jgi:aminopeptidase N
MNLQKTIFTFMLAILSTIAFAQQGEDVICKDLSYIVEAEQHHHKHIIDFRTNELTQNYDLKYHRLSWEVDPAVLYIKGEVTSYFMPIQDDFNQINFDFKNNMTVNEVIYHGNSLSYVQVNDNLRINLPATIELNTLDSITVRYEGAPGSSGFGSFENAYHNGTPVLWTLSEPYGAKNWWPCKQDLTDKIDSIDIFVKTPAEYRVGSNGKLMSETAEGEDMIYHWKHRYPIPAYLISIAVTNYTVFSDYVSLDNGESIEVLNYVFPEDYNYAQSQLENTVEIMELFNELFGIYPFADEKYGHAQFAWGGGMEHQTMSSMGGFSYGLQAHELAHQWFGDKVTCGSWQDIWLNEGFATYLTALTDEYKGNTSSWNSWKNGTINNITSQAGGSVWVDDTTSVSRIFSYRLSYLKGAYLLHMLRWKLGDDDFYQAIRNYVDDPALAYGYARTEDLQAHLEAQSGQDLTPFMEDWFYGQGYPSYHLGWSTIGNIFQVQLNQETSHSSVDFFEMPVPILVYGEGQDSILRLEHTANDQFFEIDLPFVVEAVQFDPDRWILSKDNTVDQVISATNDQFLHNAIKLSPNPASAYVDITINAQDLDISKIEVSNTEGKLLQTIITNDKAFRIDTRDWPVGTYYVSFWAGHHKAVKKLVKH